MLHHASPFPRNVQPIFPNPEILHLLLQMTKNKQVLTIKMLESANIWHFCLKNDFWQLISYLISW